MRTRRATLGLILGMLAATLAGCGSSHATRAGSAPAAPSLAEPLAASIQAAGGTWAVVPMGRLDQPINTFWQLLYLPDGGRTWSNRVEATATATNGGLLLAGAGRSLTVGIRPSTLLRFTPLITTTDAGGHWADGLIDGTVAGRSAAMAADEAGDELALTGAGRSGEVLSSAGNRSMWHQLVTEGTLAANPAGRACRLGAITAVSYLAGRPLIGATCAAPGVIGLLSPAGRGWRLAGVAAPAGDREDRFEVLWMHDSASSTTALLAAVAPGGTSLIALDGNGSGRWSLSGSLPLADGVQISCVAPGGAGGGPDVLLGVPGGPSRLATTATGGRWRTLPEPPEGTTTVAAPSSGRIDAFAGSGDALTVWTLGPGAAGWTRQQGLHVPVQYGSSS